METQVTTLETLEKRVAFLEKLHIWGFVGVTVALVGYIYYTRQ